MSLTSRPLIVCLLPATLLAAGCDRQSAQPVQANASATAEPPISADEVAPTGPAADAGKVRPDYSHAGKAMPPDAFADAAGKPVTMAAFKGKPVLVNLWATWCAPCVAELPTLDALAKREAGKLIVLTVSQDTEAGKASAFWAQRKLDGLALYTDPEVKLSVAYAATLPTTVLYDSAGKEVLRLTGGFDWAGPDAAALIAKAK